jgi:hypothetical protein
VARVEINEVTAGRDGRPLPGASVQVNVHGAGAATVYAGETGVGTLPNPLASDALGRINGWVDAGTYDLVVTSGKKTTTIVYEAVSAAGASSGSGLPPGWVTPTGLVGDGVTDNAAAIQAAIDSPSSVNQWAGTTVVLPPGNFFCSTTILLRRAGTILRGVGRGRQQQTQSGITRLTFPNGVTGLKTIHPGVTSGPRGDWSIIENLEILAQGNSIAGAHGIQIDFKCWVRNCFILGFSGNGIHIQAGVPNQNANESRIDWTRCESNKGNGFFCAGGDSNNIVINGLSCATNGLWGINDQSFLGNTYIGCHTEDNGTSTAVASTLNGGITAADTVITLASTAGFSAIGGVVKIDNEQIPYTGIAGNQLTGCKRGSVPANPPAAVHANGAAVRQVYGGYMTFGAVNYTQFYNCYSESGQGTIGWINSPAIAWGGDNMNYNYGNGSIIQPNAPGLTIDKVTVATGAGSVSIGGGFRERLSDPDAGEYFDYYNAGDKGWGPYYNNGGDPALLLTTAGHAAGGNHVCFKNGIHLSTKGKDGVLMRAGAQPAAGTWSTGDIVFNSAPVAGGKVGWVCTAGGTPGTWKPFGAIDP